MMMTLSMITNASLVLPSLSTPLSHSANSRRASSSVAFAHTDFCGTQLASGHAARGASRVTSAAVLLAPSTARSDLLEQIEERWLRAHDEPSEDMPASYDEFSEALSNYDFNFSIGEKVSGIVFQADAAGALVDIGAKAPAFLPVSETCLYKVKDLSLVGLFPGAQGEFTIVDEDDRFGRMILSLRKVQYEFAWERCRQLLTDDITVFGKVLAVNRGGLLVQVEGLRGFVPMSLVALRNPDKEELVGLEIALKVLEVDEERARLVLSNRRAMTENSVQAFNIGDVVEGTVQSVKPYGAFVDIGGVNGLLHISQISHDRISNVETVLQEGDTLKVMILSHDRDKGRLSLSTKKLEPTPGDMLRNPQLVYEKADEMANTFRERVAAAEAASRMEELKLQEGYNFPMPVDSGAPLDSLPSV